MVFFERQQLSAPDGDSARNNSGLPESTLSTLAKYFQTRNVRAGNIIADNNLEVAFICYLIKGSLSLEVLRDGTASKFEFREKDFFRISPLLRIPNIKCLLKASSDCRLLEIEADKLSLLPDSVQISVLTGLHKSQDRFSSELIQQNIILSKNIDGLISYLITTDSRLKDATSSQVIQDLLARIPKLPSFAFDLIYKLQDDSFETKEVVSKIQSDPSLASLVLKTVNSSYYGFAEKISDIYKAVLLLGFNNIYQLVLTQGLASIMPNNPESLEIQAHSSLISLLAQEIAGMTGKVSPAGASTMALLHEVGRIVVLLLKQKYANIGPLFNLLDTSFVGGRLLRSWGLPENICEVVEHQAKAQFVQPTAIKAHYRAAVAVIYLAHVCHDHLLGTRQTQESFIGDYMILLGFNPVSGTVFFWEKVMEVLMQNIRKFPEHIRSLVIKASSGKRSLTTET